MSNDGIYQSVQFGTDNRVLTDADRNNMNGDALQRAIFDGTRPADPTAVRITDTSLYRNGESVQKHASIQLIDHGDSVLMSDGSRVKPAVAETLERQSHLRIVRDEKPVSTLKEEVEVAPTPEHAKDAYSKAVMADEATQDSLRVFNNGLSMAARLAAVQEMTTKGELSDNWYKQASAQLDATPEAVKGVIDNALTGLDRGYRVLCERAGISPEAATAYINKHHSDTARSVAVRVLATGDLSHYGPLLRAAKQAGVK